MNEEKQSGVRAVIFDISGTVLDYGSRGPVVAFAELFARYGVAVTEEQSRLPMGTHKREHIRSILNMPEVSAMWLKAQGSLPTPERLEELYAEFTAVQLEVLKRHCDVIPGVPELMAELHRRGLKVASTTGYETAMMVDLIPLAMEGGYTPDLWVCPDMVGGGRPAPWMAFHAAREFNIYPMSSFVKVGDTPIDVAEARSAGMWAVSVTQTGNEVGLSQAALAAMPEGERAERTAAAHARLSASGPHYILESVAALPPVLDEIEARLARGERP